MLQPNKLDQQIDQLLEKAGEKAANLAKETDLFRTSQSFKDKIISYPMGHGVQVVVSQAPWSSYLEEGTRPHIIEGNPMLHFYWEKHDVFMTLPRVQHPGTSPKPYMSEAASKTDEMIPTIWEQITRK